LIVMAQAPKNRSASPGAAKPKQRPSVSPVADFWFSLFEAADVQGKTVLDWSAPLWDPRLLQKKWLEVLSQTMDGCLRSTAFLELMQQCAKMSAPGDSNGKAAGPPDEIIEGDSHR